MLFSKNRLTKCKICKSPFVKVSMTHKVCSPECALDWLEIERDKKEAKSSRIEKRIDREKKIALKTRSDWMKEAQVAFNAFIRQRDKGKPCICCGLDLGMYEVGGAFDCGHYRSVGSAPHLRFHEDNAHGQRKKCNRWGAGRAVDYRIGLIKRIGVDRVEALESDNAIKKFTIDDLKSIIKTYKEKLKQLKDESKCTPSASDM